MIEICDGLFLSNYGSAKNERILELNSIKCIITVAKNLNLRLDKEKYLQYKYDFEDDNEQILIDKFEEIYDIIFNQIEQRKNVLVHW
jgi:protein-tyrosine phosphatase